MIGKVVLAVENEDGKRPWLDVEQDRERAEPAIV